MLVAPEIWLPGYNSDRIADLAQPRGGPWHQRLAALCRHAGCALTVGYAERDGATVYNAAVTLDAQGVEVAHYRKIQLYGPREHAIYAPGDAYTIFDLGGTRTALLICYDIEFSPHVAALAAQGVRLILVPTANMAPFTHVVRFSVPAMAASQYLAIAYANFCGSEGDLTYVGGSQIVGPEGGVLAVAGEGTAILIADLPPLDVPPVYSMAADFRPV